MKRTFRNVSLLSLGLLILLPLVAYWAVDTWLESSGGRQMIEKNLSARLGMKVVLGGEFDLMLFPAVGVNGTDLVIESDQPGHPFASSAEYEFSVALKPLLDRRVQIDWIRLGGGVIHPGLYRGRQPSGVNGESGNIRVPEIEELTIRDFLLVPPAADARGIRLNLLKVSGFADGRSAPFVVEVQGLASARGRVLLNLQDSSLQLNGLSLERSGQRLVGRACVDFGGPLTVHAELEADRLDIDRLRNELPDTGAWASGDGEATFPDIRVRVRVDELSAGGAVAQGVVLSLGQEPVCGSD